ncbi:histidinol-phosphate transaminase [bacterium]|nr:histidinol-phosphate transaminase [bacterium]
MSLNKKEFPQARNIIDSLTPYNPGTGIKQDLKQTPPPLKLSSNENTLNSPLTDKEWLDCVAEASVYPNSSEHPLITCLSSQLNLNTSNILFGNGSDECFQLIAQSFLNPGDTVLSSEHTFSVYKAVTQIMDAVYVSVPMQHYAHDFDAYLNAITDKTKLIFVANPNNPTGTFSSYNTLLEFFKKVPSHILIVLDEAYKEYVTNESCNLSIDLIKTFHNLVITRTFSKIYGLAGLRIGYAMGDPEIIATTQKVKPPFNVNQIALNAAHVALTQKQSFIAQSIDLNTKGHAFYKQAHTSWPVTRLDSKANFETFILKQHNAMDIYHHCLDDGISIRPLDSFGLPNGIRITIGTDKQNQRVVDSLSNFFKQNT